MRRALSPDRADVQNRARAIARLRPSGSVSVRISAGGAVSLDPWRATAPGSTTVVPHLISVHRVVGASHTPADPLTLGDAAITFNARIGADDKAPATTIRLHSRDGLVLNAADDRGQEDTLALGTYAEGLIKNIALDPDDAVRALEIDVVVNADTAACARFTVFVAREAGYATAVAAARRFETTGTCGDGANELTVSGVLRLPTAAASSSAPGVTSDLFDAGSSSSVPTSSPPVDVKPTTHKPLPRPTPGGAGQVLDASRSAEPRGSFALSLLGRVAPVEEEVEEDEEDEEAEEPSCDCEGCRPKVQAAPVSEDEEGEEGEEDEDAESSHNGTGLFGSSPAGVGQPQRPTIARKLQPSDRLPDPSPENPNATVFLAAISRNGFPALLRAAQADEPSIDTVLDHLVGMAGSDVVARAQQLKRRVETLRRQAKDFARDPAAAQRILDEAKRNGDELQQLLLKAATGGAVTVRWAACDGADSQTDDLLSPQKRQRSVDADSPRKRSRPSLDTMELSPMLARIAKSCPHRAAELAAAKPILRENLIAGCVEPRTAVADRRSDVIGTLGVSGLVDVGIKPGTAAAIVQAVERESDAS